MNPFDVFDEDRPSVAVTMPSKKLIKEKPKVDHTEARKIYEAYLVKSAELKRQQAYAEQVAKATHGGGMTPVMPLATMGKNGCPLLCDHCHKPMLLEGGKFNKVYADVAWRKNPDISWKSYISGGMVVQIVENYTLRIYHGYPNVATHCCTIADEKRRKEEAAFVKDLSKCKMIAEFLESEKLPANILSEIVNVMFAFDPGIGINKI